MSSATYDVQSHRDVMRVLTDHETFSSVVSAHQAVPNGYDQPEHSAYRKALDPLLSLERVRAFEPSCRRLAAQLVDEAVSQALEQGNVETHQRIALPFALRVQSSYLGWHEAVQEQLRLWLEHSQEATRSGDKERTAAAAQEFEELIDGICARRKDSAPEQDITSALMHVQVFGRRLNLSEIASVLRNWTVGEVGTISASIGILLHWLGSNPQWQKRLRQNRALLPAAIDEVLRLDGPLASNRRVARRDTELSTCPISAGGRISINWIEANRDPEVFPDPHKFVLERCNPHDNLLYGAGIHVCPGASLARMELLVFMQELLNRTSAIELSDNAEHEPVRAQLPDTGYIQLHIRLSPLVSSL